MEQISLEKFIELVADMRMKQTIYFRNRNASALDAAKAAERVVDDCIKREKERGLGMQQKMFGE